MGCETVAKAFKSIMDNLQKEKGDLICSMDIFERCWSLYEDPRLLATLVMSMADKGAEDHPVLKLIKMSGMEDDIAGKKLEAKITVQSRTHLTAGLLKYGNFIEEDRAIIRKALLPMVCGLVMADGTSTIEGPNQALNMVIKMMGPEVLKECEKQVQQMMDDLPDAKPTPEKINELR